MSKLKLFFAPHTCALAPLIALEEIGEPFEIELVRLARAEQNSAEYLRLNPKGKVPTLLADGEPLTENPVILSWLNESYPDARLLPLADNSLARHQLVSDLVFIGSTLHPAVAHYAMPMRFVTDATDPIEIVRPAGEAALKSLLSKVEDRLEEGPWWYGAEWSIVDAYLHWVWSRVAMIGFPQEGFRNLLRHEQLMLRRPSVMRARDQERCAIERLKAEGIYKAPS